MSMFQFSASNSSGAGGSVTGSNQAGTVFNLGPGSTSGLTSNTLLILGGVALVALLLLRKRRG